MTPLTSLGASFGSLRAGWIGWTLPPDPAWRPSPSIWATSWTSKGVSHDRPDRIIGVLLIRSWWSGLLPRNVATFSLPTNVSDLHEQAEDA